MHGAFAFPVLVGDKVVAVLEFFDEKADELDESLLATVGHIGGELGWVFKRELAMAQLEKEKMRAEQFSKMATGRELRMIEMKKEVDELLERLGEEPRYK